MKRMIGSVCAAAVLAALAAAPCLAADTPWNGTWKLNQEKSNLTGDTFTVTNLGGGRMHYTNGSTVSYDFACDGKDYTILANRTGTCIRNSANSYDVTTKINGVVVARNHREISGDGKTLTMNIIGTRPDGTKFTETDVYTRLLGLTGLEGKWKNVKLTSSAADVMVIRVSPTDAIHWDIPGYKESLDGKMDGRPIPVSGPTVPAGLTLSFRKVASFRITYQVRLNDLIMDEGEQVLSVDGKTLTDTSWVAGKATEKQIAVYDKQ
jgi:hypothetical protein